MEVTQWTGCHGNDETARVRRSRCSVMCRVALEASCGSDRDRVSVCKVETQFTLHR